MLIFTSINKIYSHIDKDGSDALVEITNLDMCNPISSELMTGDPVEIGIVIAAGKCYDSINIDFEIGCDGCFPLLSFSDDLNYDEKQIYEGDNMFKCYLDKLPLEPGDYDLCISIKDQNTGAEIAERGYFSTAFRFVVGCDAGPVVVMRGQ